MLNEAKTEATVFCVPYCKAPPTVDTINICGCDIAPLRPSAHHALPHCTSLAAGPMANQQQDSSVDLPCITRSRIHVHC